MEQQKGKEGTENIGNQDSGLHEIERESRKWEEKFIEGRERSRRRF